MRTCIIFNPTARGDKAQRLRRLLETFAHDCRCQPTTRPGEARSLAAEAVAGGFETIVAAGGDGTVNEVLNGMGDVPQGYAKARLGVLPMGTVNVFARELKLPLGLESAWKTILRGQELTIDLPRAEFQSNGATVTRYFAQLAGAGLDSRAVSLVDWKLKKKIGPLAYVAAGVKALSRKQSMITVTSAAGSISGEMVLIGNGKFYGGSFVFFTRAELRDGLLDVCVFPRVNWQIFARSSLGLATNRLHRLAGAGEISSPAVALSADQQTFLQLDGDNVGELPARFSIQPRTLRVIVP